MLMLHDILAGITPGQLPLAIGTSFAVESTLGILDKDKYENNRKNSILEIDKNETFNVNTNNISGIKEIWFNIRTLFRNIYNSLDDNIKENLSAKVAADVTINEMNMVLNIYQQYNTGIKINFYVCSYNGIAREFPKATFRDIKTEKQKHYIGLENSVADYCSAKLNNIKKFDVKLKGSFSNVLILTHLSIDLLWKKYFTDLLLLESHTGSIKKYPEWYKKLTNGKDMPYIPFNYFTIQLFGDNGNYFKPFIPAIKKQITDLAKERRWTSITTKDKVIHDINTLRDISTKKYLLEMCKGW